MDVRRSIGYLPEHNPLYLDMYVKEYLQFIGSLHGFKGGRLGERIADMVERVGLTREQNKKIGALSKGYRQRVGLAQALIHDPQVLILDEPTTGLDPNQIVEIRQVIKDAGRDKTVIFSTHIMQEVEALCDRVVIINLGRIVADSTLAELRARQENARGLLLVEFEKDVNIRVLSTIPGVKEVRPKGQGKYQFVTDGRPDVRIAIFQLAAQREWTLIGLRQEESNLEKIFQQLTREGAAPPEDAVPPEVQPNDQA
jgi:ABC-2 type transport system ATP-binding protein